MTPEERQMLQSFGIALWNNFRLTLGPSLLYGMFVPLVIVTSYDLVKTRGISSFRTRATLCIILLGLISATGYIITILADIIYPVNLTFLANLGIPLEARLAITDAQLQTWTIASTWFQDLPILLNDGIIVWRASAIFARKRWALYLLTALWGITAGARPCVSVLDDFDHLHAGLLVFTISYAIIASVPTPSAMAVTDSSIIFYLYTGFSIGTNFLATSFIAYILRGHLKLIRNSVDAKQRSTFKVWKILLLLVDMGFGYCALQIFTFVITLIPRNMASSFFFGVTAYGYIFNMIEAMYTTLVTFLINGPFSIAGIHEAATAVYESQSRPPTV